MQAYRSVGAQIDALLAQGSKKQLITSLPQLVWSHHFANQSLGSANQPVSQLPLRLINFLPFESPVRAGIVSFLCVNLASIGFSHLRLLGGARLVVIKSARKKKCLIDGPSTKESVETARSSHYCDYDDGRLRL